MSNNFINGIDRNMWVQVSPSPNAHAAAGSLAVDLRNDSSRVSYIYHLVSAAVLNSYNQNTKSWKFELNPGLGGTYGAGAGCVFAPSLSISGSIGASSTSQSIVTSTVLPYPTGVNIFADKCGISNHCGYRIRIIGNSAGGTGKIESMPIVGNTGTTSPTFYLSSSISFAPASGDTYEIQSGRVFMLSAGALAATIFRAYDVSNTASLVSLSNTNLVATVSTEFSGIALDELYVPYDAIPGEGFLQGTGSYDNGLLNCLVATGSSASTLTGQPFGGDASVLANEYRNFQIHIVEDTGTPTAVNQRRIIASHTAGPSPTYTLGANWSVTPSATAKFVIEYPNQILLWSSANAVTYTYNYSNYIHNNGTNTINPGAWSATYYGNRGGNMGAGCTSFQSFGIRPDVGKQSRHSYIYSFRGGNSVILDLLDIAGGTTGAWSNAIQYQNNNTAINTGTCGKYAAGGDYGKYGYINIYVASAVNQIYRFDVMNRRLMQFTPTDWLQAGTAAVGDRVMVYTVSDGSTKYSVVFLMAHLSTICQEIIVLT